MSLSGPGGGVPPNLRNPGSVPRSSPLPDEVIDDLDCIACGTYLEIQEPELTILSVCQRATNPCLVEIDYEAKGDGVYDLEETQTLFSLDSTNGINGTWHVLEPLRSDPRHTTDFPAPDVPGGVPYDRIEVHGKVYHRFVADMCDHVSTFMEDLKIVFRLTFRKASGFPGPGGGVTPGLR